MPFPVVRGSFARTRDHWQWRDGWGPGTRYLTWHLTFEGETALHDASRRFAGAVRDVAAVDVVPVEWLHLTMSGVGFAREVSEASVTAMVDEVLSAAADVDAEPLVFDGLVLFGDALSLTTRATWLDDLKLRQEAAVARVVRATAGAGDRFAAHVTLAYFSGVVDEVALLDAAAGLDPVIVQRPTLSLLELGRDDRMYTWETVAAASLGG